MRITNEQIKLLYGSFENGKIDVSDFISNRLYGEFSIKYKFDYFSFTVKKKSEDSYLLTTYTVFNVYPKNREVKNWKDVVTAFSMWAGQIKKEINTPTGFETIESQNFVNPEVEDLTSEFNPVEKEKIRGLIEDAKRRILDIELPQDKLETILIKMDELSSKVDSMKRFDWKSLFIGTVANLIMTLGLPPEAAGSLWQIMKNSFFPFRLNL